MTDTKTTGLTEYAGVPANGDWFMMIDVSDTSMAPTGTNKRYDAKRFLHTNGTANTLGANLNANGYNITGAGTLSGSIVQAVADGNSLSVGSGANVAAYVNVAGPRTYFGYDGNNIVVQGGSGKGIVFAVNNATFGSGTVGYFSSAGDLYLLNNLDVTGRVGSAWANITFNTGWNSLSGYQVCQYKRVGDMIFLRGMAQRSSGTETVLFTLPAGFRPPDDEYLNVYTTSGPGVLAVAPTGNVSLMAGGAGWVSLSCIVLSTAA